jgi:anti-anti-sigma factor
MQSHVTANATVKIFKIEGRFGTGRIPLIENVLPNDMTRKYKVLAFDMSGAKDVDSSALSFLIQMLNRCKKVGMEMILVGVPDPVMEILRAATLDKFFTIMPMSNFERIHME